MRIEPKSVEEELLKESSIEIFKEMVSLSGREGHSERIVASVLLILGQSPMLCEQLCRGDRPIIRLIAAFKKQKTALSKVNIVKLISLLWKCSERKLTEAEKIDIRKLFERDSCILVREMGRKLFAKEDAKKWKGSLRNNVASLSALPRIKEDLKHFLLDDD